jgi:hypothetical protein
MDITDLIVIERDNEVFVLDEECSIGGVRSIRNLGLESISPKRAAITPWPSVNINSPRISNSVKSVDNLTCGVFQLVSTDDRVGMACW